MNNKKSRYWLPGLLTGALGASVAGASADTPIHFRTEAQDLSSALVEIGRQSGAQVLFAHETVRGHRAQDLDGVYTLNQALALVLEGSGLVVTKEADGQILAVQAPSPVIPVRSPILLAQNAPAPRPAAAAEAAAPRATTPPGSAALEEIVVSARKREENLQDIPVAVSAFSTEKIEELGAQNLQDLSRFSPGLDVQNQGATIAGRFVSGIRFRGMNPTALTPSFQVGALFVDGVFFLGGAQSVGFDDIERVEVIRGPQSAYFGRSTFGGAVNYITKDPAREFDAEIRTDFSPSYKTETYELAGAIEGPLLGDALFGRLSASSRQKGAQYTATDGGFIGEERTNAVHGTLLWEPNERLRAKLRISYSEDEDGPAPGSSISFTRYGNCPIGTPVSFLDTLQRPVSGRFTANQHCGALPENVPITASTSFPTQLLPVAVFTGIPAGRPGITGPLDVRATLVDNIYGSPLLDAAPRLDRFGLKRESLRYSLALGYEISPRFRLEGNLGYNEQDAISIRDSDYSDFPLIFVATPYSFNDRSAEARVRYDGGRLRGLLGANVYRQRVNAIYTNAVEATFGFAGTPLTRPHPLSNPAGAFDRIETTGVFASVEYDILPTLTATLEARRQKDTVDRFAGNQLVGVSQLPESLVSTKTVPRAILSWRPLDSTTIYASFAQGTLPGDINSNLDTLQPSDLQQALALLGSVARTVPAEELDSYEIGLKQTLADGRLRYALTGYYMDWTNQKSSASVFLPIARTQTFRVVGNSEIKGIEFEGSWLVTDNFQVDATFAYTDAKYADFRLPGNGPFLGVNTLVGYNAAGNTLPRFPETQGTLSGTYRGNLNANWSWNLRGDLIHVGKSYIDEFNFAWVDPYQLVNLRFGLTRGDDLSIDLYVSNALQERGWGTGAGNFDLTTGPVQLPLAPGVTPAAVVIARAATVSPIDQRAVGLRIGYRF